MNSKYFKISIPSLNNKEIYISACSSHKIQFKKYSIFTNHNISLDCHSDHLRTTFLCPLTIPMRHRAKGSHGQCLCCLWVFTLCISSWKRLWLLVILVAQKEVDKNTDTPIIPSCYNSISCFSCLTNSLFHLLQYTELSFPKAG